jgi:hypothetical protein
MYVYAQVFETHIISSNVVKICTRELWVLPLQTVYTHRPSIVSPYTRHDCLDVVMLWAKTSLLWVLSERESHLSACARSPRSLHRAPCCAMPTGTWTVCRFAQSRHVVTDAWEKRACSASQQGGTLNSFFSPFLLRALSTSPKSTSGSG